MVESAVEQFQTAEQVISQSYPLGQSPPQLSTRGEGNIPTAQVPAQYLHEEKSTFFP